MKKEKMEMLLNYFIDKHVDWTCRNYVIDDLIIKEGIPGEYTPPPTVKDFLKAIEREMDENI